MKNSTENCLIYQQHPPLNRHRRGLDQKLLLEVNKLMIMRYSRKGIQLLQMNLTKQTYISLSYQQETDVRGSFNPLRCTSTFSSGTASQILIYFYCSIIKSHNIPSMAKQNHSSAPHHYSTISLETRQALVDLVISMGFSIGQAARRLKVKLSTAKMIVKRFRTQGDFFESKRQRIERQGAHPRSSPRNKHIFPDEDDKALEQVQPALSDCAPTVEPSLLYFPLAVGESHYWPWLPCQFSPLQQGFFVEPLAGAMYGYSLMWEGQGSDFY